MTQTRNGTNIHVFMQLLSNCQELPKIKTLKFYQKQKNELSYWVVSKDKCNFVKKNYCHNDPKKVKRSFFYNLIDYRNFYKFSNVFMENSVTVQQKLSTLCRRLFEVKKLVSDENVL